MDIKSPCADDCITLFSDTVYRLALAHMGNRFDADDVYQDVFLKLSARIRTFENSEHAKAWLIRATVNRCKSLKTSAWFRKTKPLDETAPSPEPPDPESDLVPYLQLLPNKYRPVIHLFYGEELSVKEIAEVLKAKESTVRAWLTRARAILREKLKGDCFL